MYGVCFLYECEQPFKINLDLSRTHIKSEMQPISVRGDVDPWTMFEVVQYSTYYVSEKSTSSG